MPNYIIGQEVIDFQINSKLAETTTDIFQSIIDYRDKLITELEQQPDISAKSIYELLEPKIVDFTAKQCVLMLRIFSTRFNLPFIGFRIVHGQQFPTSMIGIDSNFTDEFTTIQPAMRGQQQTPLQAVETLAKIFQGLDYQDARSTIDIREVHKFIQFKLLIDINTCFLAPYTVPDTQFFTARELTAIYLHELGHAFTQLEQCGHIYADALAMRQSFAALKQTQYPVATAKDMLQTLEPVLKQIPLAADKEYKRVADTLIQDLKVLSETNLPEDDNTGTISNSLSMTWNVLVDAFYGLGVIFTGKFIRAELETALGNEKTTDTTNTTWYLKNCERKADEFCARFGYGADMTTALQKQRAILTSPLSKAIYNKTIAASRHLDAIVHKFRALGNFLDLRMYLDPQAYESDYRRTESVLTDTYGYFKQLQTQKVDVQHWLDTIDQIKSILKAQRTVTIKSTVAKAIYNVLRTLLNPGRWWELLRTGGLHQDMDILNRHLRQMNNNPLYYLADKLAR